MSNNFIVKDYFDIYDPNNTDKVLVNMPENFISCKAVGCNHWFSARNKSRKGYCHAHRNLITV